MTVEEYLSIYQGVTVKRLMTSLALSEKEVADELSQISHKVENGLVYLTEPSAESEPIAESVEPEYLTPEEIWLAIFYERNMQTWNGHEWVLYRKSNPKSIREETGKVRYSLPMHKIDGVQVEIGTDIKPKNGQKYYVPCLISQDMHEWRIWSDSQADNHALDIGMVHLSADTAKTHARVLLRASGVKV